MHVHVYGSDPCQHIWTYAVSFTHFNRSCAGDLTPLNFAV